ncbi:hypothetical protein M3E00_02745 [Dietzia cinnamea]|uniref:hypothetical protein n=1 Tax=Dietzia TaxID=37914 RepID=UPI0021A44822|nr:hypothetical protein [Dietzia cinnamea]MCT2097514.1 hypothetical protein [Dietzia cinnamea]
MMADKLPQGPTAPARKKRELWSDLTATAQQSPEQAPPDAPERAAQEPDLPSSPITQVTKKSTKNVAGGKTKGWDRSGQIAVVLGKERHARLKDSWKRNATTYDAIADLVREAIDEKLDQLERER